ncbi:MAG: N-acetylmuramoyl-L-alanine amidase [Phycisphaerales bacterium]|nr:N-acetylmuramoyl-L-alanine amidase [Phycisphaerales bacterium]
MKPSLPIHACLLLCLWGIGLLVGCAAPGPYGQPGEPLQRLGDEIVVCGQFFHTGAPVVLWLDAGGYDAYRAHRHFNPAEELPSDPVSKSPVRFSTYRRHLPEDVAAYVRTNGWDLPLLQEWVDLFVIHYDACGTARRCFEVLHDLRGLSVHFMLDVDGTIYQTLDLKERAWHAGTANDRSVGIEIANIGAYRDTKVLDQWYTQDEQGRTVMQFPAGLGATGIRTPDFVGRPSRNELVRGAIHGRELMQYDLTDAQYESLIKLTATLCQVLPRIAAEYPRDAEGQLRLDELTADEIIAFSGLIGHWHITAGKVDPGPAFDWDRVLHGVRVEMLRR